MHRAYSTFTSYLSFFTRYRSENWILCLKLQNKIKIFYKYILADGHGMAVGWQLKLTMPILVHSKFLQKIDPKLFCIFNSKWSSEMAQILGPQIYELAIFLPSPFEIWICVRKIFKWVHSGPIGRPPIFQNGPQNGAWKSWVGNFF